MSLKADYREQQQRMQQDAPGPASHPLFDHPAQTGFELIESSFEDWVIAGPISTRVSLEPIERYRVKCGHCGMWGESEQARTAAERGLVEWDPPDLFGWRRGRVWAAVRISCDACAGRDGDEPRAGYAAGLEVQDGR